MEGGALMTINEYKSESGLTNSQLADLLDVSESSIEKYLMGDATSAAIAKRMSKLGIEHPNSKTADELIKKSEKFDAVLDVIIKQADLPIKFARNQVD